MNKTALMLAGVTEHDYKKWCKDNNKSAYKTATKTEFFARLQDGRLVKDKDGNLIKVRQKHV